MDINQYCYCPVCLTKLDNSFFCETCKIQFPILNNIPVLINEKNSIFSFEDYTKEQAYSFFGEKGKYSILKKIIPNPNDNYAAEENYKLLIDLLSKKVNPSILVVGGGVTGSGMQNFLSHKEFRFLLTDVSLTGNIQLVCDCHNLPFDSGAFDCVIAQAVLEHVVDPYQCVNEIHRVLKERGIVYAETPFIQQVHGGAYDFTRFTWLGHRRLFRKFKEIQSGTCCGPGMALSWSWRYFLTSFSKRGKSHKSLNQIGKLTSFFWLYFDKYLSKRPGSIDASSGNYFIGFKDGDYLLEDKELVHIYNKKKNELSE